MSYIFQRPISQLLSDQQQYMAEVWNSITATIKL